MKRPEGGSPIWEAGFKEELKASLTNETFRLRLSAETNVLVRSVCVQVRGFWKPVLIELAASRQNSRSSRPNIAQAICKAIVVRQHV